MTAKLRPAYVVDLPSGRLAFDELGPLVRLEVRRAKNAGADVATVALGRRPGVEVSLDDEVTVELGWGEATSIVFTGNVQRVDRGLERLEFTAAGVQTALMRAHPSRNFVEQTAGQVVSALASDAGVDVEAEDGIDLPRYVCDPALSAYEHCQRLAECCGFDLYATAEGLLVFGAFDPNPFGDHAYRYAAELLSAGIEREEPFDSVTVVAESPASGAGADAASWLVKDSSAYAGQAGAGPVSLLRADPVLRTKEAGVRAARGWLERGRRGAVRGSVELMGDPEVALGDTVGLREVPDDQANGVYEVTALRHVLGPGTGFRTFLALGGMP